jgi:hypothetical protein
LSRKGSQGPRTFGGGAVPMPEGARTGRDGMYGSLFDLVDAERLRTAATARAAELKQIKRRRGGVDP